MTQNNNVSDETNSTEQQNDDGFDLSEEVDEATDMARKEILRAVREGEKEIDQAAVEIDATLNQTVSQATDGGGETKTAQPEIPLDDAFSKIYDQLEAQGMNVDEMLSQNLMQTAEDILHSARKDVRYNQKRR